MWFSCSRHIATAAAASSVAIGTEGYRRKAGVSAEERPKPPGCLMVGTGEYVTGMAGGKAANSDKSTGVLGLCCLDFRLRGKIERLGMVGVNGPKLPAVRSHMQRALSVYDGIDPSVIETWPADTKVDPEAYREAAAAFKPGDMAIIFTPDDSHFDIAMACMERGMHVMITKPPVKTVKEHRALVEAAKKHNVLCVAELHKRFDPFYLDARDRIRSSLGPFSYYWAYMSQPKHQLETFKAWAGKSSDISYYLNSHHIDYHEWCMHGRARPTRVVAHSSNGVAKTKLDGVETEDTITIVVDWRNFEDASIGHGVYTSSWIAPKADVHSQQRWFYMGQKGEITEDQAHRGYSVCQDDLAYCTPNPLFWKPQPSDGKFSGQRTYGYLSFEAFIDAVAEVNSGRKKPSDFDGVIPTLGTIVGTTAILEAGRRSLDEGGQPYELVYESDDIYAAPVGIRPVKF
jgi:D-galacturonate reductase